MFRKFKSVLHRPSEETQVDEDDECSKKDLWLLDSIIELTNNHRKEMNKIRGDGLSYSVFNDAE